jgi:hypothetical protein
MPLCEIETDIVRWAPRLFAHYPAKRRGAYSSGHCRTVGSLPLPALLVDCAGERIICLEMQLLADNRPAKSLVIELDATRTTALDSVTHYTLDVSKTLFEDAKQPTAAWRSGCASNNCTVGRKMVPR